MLAHVRGDGLDEDTRDPMHSSSRRVRPRRIGLTVLYHFDPERIGERAHFDRGRISLSRGRPWFFGTDDRSGRPLADPFLSRDPVELALTPDGVAIDPSPLLRVDGARVVTRTVVSSSQLAEGVVLELSDRVVLMLGELEGARDTLDLGLVGESPAIQRLRREILRIARLDVPVLLLGETGTGKELVASAIHRFGARAEAALVALNLAAVHPSVASSALFGHQRGSFTGAIEDHEGYFGRADGGTLFLDEIGAASLEVQAILLRALEGGAVQRVGGTQERTVNLRAIAATDSDLGRAVREGTFRRALLHRLAGCELRIPPLRERKDDIGRLWVHFAREELRSSGRALERNAERPWMPPEVMVRLIRYSWPGNVRQLKNVVRGSMLALSEDPRELERVLDRLLEEDPMPEELVSQRPGAISDEELEHTLEATEWRIERAAEQLGISRTSIYRRIEAHPTLRIAKDLTAEEIERAQLETGGNIALMSSLLRVSRAGIRQRIQQLKRS